MSQTLDVTCESVASTKKKTDQPAETAAAVASGGTKAFLTNWSISELNTQVNSTTCLGGTDCWFQQVTAPTLVVTCWMQQVTTRVGAVTCWIQQSVSPTQVVGFSCLFNKEVDQLISKAEVACGDNLNGQCSIPGLPDGVTYTPYCGN